MKKSISIFFTVFFSLCLSAQTKNTKNLCTVTFTPNHTDWVYAVGDSVELDIQVRKYNIDLPNQPLTLTWGMEMSAAEQTYKISTDANGRATLRLKGSDVPGFKTCAATAVVDGNKYWNYITVGFEPDKIEPTTPMPNDFEQFWAQALAEARKVPLNPVFTLLPELCTPLSDTYMISFHNRKYGENMYGILKVPKDVEHSKKKYPAVLEVPGAGIRNYKGLNDDYSKAGIVSLQLGIHGIPVNLPEQVYNNLANGALNNYNSIRCDDRDQYYYKRVYTGCVKAIDFLCSLPYVDSKHIAVYGGSQGGLLSLVVAALAADKIQCVSTAYPAMSEIAGSMRGRIDGWPRLFNGNKTMAGIEDKIKVSEYYDAVNFARLVKAPMLFIQGYNDKVCPPTTTLSVYNVLSCPKQLVIEQDAAHWLYLELWNQRRDWLIEQLTSKH